LGDGLDSSLSGGGGSSGGGGAPNTGLAFDLVGIYVGTLSGSDDGSTLLEVRTTGTAGQVLITTIAGQGFAADIDRLSNITISSSADGEGIALGDGQVLGTDSFRFAVTLADVPPFTDGELQVTATRITGTDRSFPLTVPATSLAPSVELDTGGDVTVIDPASNTLLSSLVRDVQLTSTVPSLEVYIADSGTFGGTLIESQRWAMRVVADGVGEYATAPGSSADLDALGRLDFVGIGTDTFTATIITQTRDPLGSQTQRVILVDVGDTGF
jgi:hypothetical protein